MNTGFVGCGHCGTIHAGPCPRIKAIEYYPDGTMKRVEYFEQQAKVSYPYENLNGWISPEAALQTFMDK